MIPDQRFLSQPKAFWAHVRSVSQHVGYTAHSTKQVRVPGVPDIRRALQELNLKHDHIASAPGDAPTKFGALLHSYFQHRADLINHEARRNLMDAPEAKALYEETVAAGPRPRIQVPMNKQKGDKKAPAYLTAIVNTLIERAAGDTPRDFNPRELTSVTRNQLPIHTLARRVDGAFPRVINPVAMWEIKEYYYTTTFGSRVADGVYETLLDGLELEELKTSEDIHIKHYLMIDGRYTWWDCGRSYLCRMVDMLHMGYVDEVLVGRETTVRLPVLVGEWKKAMQKSAQTEELKQTSDVPLGVVKS